MLDGELGVMVGEEEFEAQAGSFVVRPKRVPHALWNPADRPVRFLDVYTPAEFEAWFDQLAGLFSATDPPTIDALIEVGRRYDVILAPELAPQLIEKPRFRHWSRCGRDSASQQRPLYETAGWEPSR